MGNGQKPEKISAPEDVEIFIVLRFTKVRKVHLECSQSQCAEFLFYRNLLMIKRSQIKSYSSCLLFSAAS